MTHWRERKSETGKGNLLPLELMAKPLLMSTESVFYAILFCDDGQSSCTWEKLERMCPFKTELPHGNSILFLIFLSYLFHVN